MSRSAEDEGETGAVVLRPHDAGGPEAAAAGRLGLAVFLASISMLFGASLVAYTVIRLRAETWPPPGAPPPPAALWVSTLLLLGCSVALHGALRGIRRGDQAGLVRRLGVTLALAVGFLASQALSWVQAYHEASFRTHLYGFLFYSLTTLHALHVVGGIAALLTVLYRAWRRRYTWARYAGVRLCATYWHYLDAVWLVIFVLLQLDR